ncbi:MAG: DNA/RNA nuclease SfsA [Gammaproteobacteria bacterium]|nr:DNA/RNA nuclease SfsA [Gammaproteobacteria bacterium]
MKYSPALISGCLIRRYKRFLADVELTTGEVVTAHTANTGAMTGCCEPGSPVWLSRSSNMKRKYAYTWELVQVANGEGSTLVGINTMLSNHLVREAIEQGVVAELQGYDNLRSEVKYGQENSRIDFLLSKAGIALSSSEARSTDTSCYVEVKNVTLVAKNTALFPDAVSKRGSKHLRELMQVVKQGGRAVIFYCVSRADVSDMKPADAIDMEYGQLLRLAVSAGVEALAYMAEVSPDEIVLRKKIPVKLV